MEIYIQMDGQQRGPFSESTITEGIKAGRFRPNDLATIHGTGSWQPLTGLLAVVEAVKVQAQPTVSTLTNETESSTTQIITSETRRPEGNTEPVAEVKNNPLDQRIVMLIPDVRQPTTAEFGGGKHICRRCGSPYNVWSLFRGIGSGLCTNCTKATAKPRPRGVSTSHLVIKLIFFTGLGSAFFRGCVFPKPNGQYFGSDYAQNERWKHSTPSRRPTDDVLKTGPDGKLVFSLTVQGQGVQRQFAASPSPKLPLWDTPRTAVLHSPELWSKEADFKRAYGEPKEILHDTHPKQDIMVYDAGTYYLRVIFWRGVAHQISVVRADLQPLSIGTIEERLDSLADGQDWTHRKQKSGREDVDGKITEVWDGDDAVAYSSPYPNDNPTTNWLVITSREFLAEDEPSDSPK